MLVERVYTHGLAQVAWLVGDESSRNAAVVDPRRDAGIYVELAKRHGLRIIAALETHVHADFVSGVLELQRLTGASVYASRAGESEFEHIPVDDGDEIQLGEVRLRAYHTPGHTPEHLSYLLFASEGAGKPTGIFTGDSLFVGEVGRPDLLGDEATEGLVRQLYETVSERFRALPDDLVVYPGHGAGSSCGRSIGSEPTTTIGQEKLGNYAFKPGSLDAFKSAVMTDLPPAPTYYPVLKRVNKAGAAPLDSIQRAGGVSAEVLAGVIASNGIVIDTRSSDDFAARHIPGTVSIGAGDNFVTWAGWLAPYDRPIYLVVDSPDVYDKLVLDLLRIGLDRIGGFLEGGIDGWASSGRPLDSYMVITAEDLHRSLEQDQDLTVVDVRAPAEWRVGHIANAHHAYLGSLIADGNGLPSKGTLAFVCGSGYRSNVAASVARLRGYHEVVNVRGGMDSWTRAGYPIVSG